jgi:hypothetical protein
MYVYVNYDYPIPLFEFTIFNFHSIYFIRKFCRHLDFIDAFHMSSGFIESATEDYSVSSTALKFTDLATGDH